MRSKKQTLTLTDWLIALDYALEHVEIDTSLFLKAKYEFSWCRRTHPQCKYIRFVGRDLPLLLEVESAYAQHIPLLPRSNNSERRVFQRSLIEEAANFLGVLDDYYEKEYLYYLIGWVARQG